MERRRLKIWLLATLALLLAAVPVLAQQITGVPGSPSATTTIQGDQIPAPPPEVRRED